MRLLAALLSFALAPCLGMAQTAVGAPSLWVAAPAHAAQAATNAEMPVAMPLWGTPDGRILAMVAFGAGSHGAPVLPQSPQIGSAADWQLIDVTNFITGGLSLRFGGNLKTYASFGRGIVLAPLNPAAASFGCDGALALRFDNACAPRAQAASRGAMRLGTDIQAGQFDLDMGYGLSWLRYGEQSQAITLHHPAWDMFATLDDAALPTLVVPGIEFANISDSGISATGRWRLDDTRSVDLSAALSRLKFDLPGNSLTPGFNQAALSLGVREGDFSGVLIGRVLGPADPLSGSQRWSSVDLGVSWRAPWRGVFSVGARNLWSSGTQPALTTDPAPHETDPAQARVPYVRYHQDL